jgi:hypothetical protein
METKTQQKTKRTYKGIKSVLNFHIKKNLRTLWTYKDDNFTCIYEPYEGNERIYTVNQMLKLIDGLILEENKNDKT